MSSTTVAILPYNHGVNKPQAIAEQEDRKPGVLDDIVNPRKASYENLLWKRI